MPQRTNRLAAETSPYLLQHAHNPVDWYPWGEEVLRRAREEGKPILLSIGYAACHWCHVMERESFEDEATARLMNEHFLNVKVDREERPDVDAVYMEAVQAMTGHGGWPLTVFLTPEGVPFFGGTYFPPEPRHGMPAFRQVLRAIAQAWQGKRGEVEESAARMRQALERMQDLRPATGELGAELLERAAQVLWSRFDDRHGGFGRAPKFPMPLVLEFLLRWHARSGQRRALAMVERTLQAMAGGGIYDQLGGGFHRYAVDQSWLVPHFEKMLYDNALLPRVYLHAYQLTGGEDYLGVVLETFAFLEREMRSPEGGFYSTLDADSEGVEGKFYVWSVEEVRRVLPAEEAEAFIRFRGLSPEGNFEGHNILHRPADLAQVAGSLGIQPEELRGRLRRAGEQLLARRAERVAPGRDEKILASWNGLLIATLAEAASALGQPAYALRAGEAAAFVLQRMRDERGRLLHSWKDGRGGPLAFLEDEAFLAEGLLRLYEATFQLHWLEEARQLVDDLLERFWDPHSGGFFSTSRDHESLITRPKDLVDSATPAGNAVAAEVMLRLAILLGEPEYQRRALEVLRLLRQGMAEQPTAFAATLCALDFHLGQTREVAIVGRREGQDTERLLRAAFRGYLPNKVVALREPADERPAQLIPLLRDRGQLDSTATAYVCRNYVCELPVTDGESLAAQLYGREGAPPA